MKNENIIDISLKLNNYQEIFDPYDNRNENVRNINPEIIEAMTNIYKDQAYKFKYKKTKTRITLTYLDYVSLEEFECTRLAIKDMFEKYKSKTKNFITLYARKFIIWLIMAFVLFSFSLIIERTQNETFLYTVLGIVVWILIDNIVETFFLNSEAKENAVMMNRIFNAEIIIKDKDGNEYHQD